MEEPWSDLEDLDDDEYQLWRARRLSGTALRHHLTVLLIEAQVERSIGDLVRLIDDEGFTVSGRPSKTISDTLRWEVRHGRARRIGRGRYVAGSMPKSTRSYLRRRVRERRGRLHDAEARAQARWLETLTISPVM